MDQVMEYRFMRLDDVEAIGDLERLAFTAPWSTEAFVNELTVNPNAKYMVAVDQVQGKVIAYCGMWLIIDEAHITNIAVHPDYRGKKIGDNLMRQMMALAIISGSERMTLEVRPSNQVARNLYQKLGFIEAGRRKRYYSDDNEDAMIMWVNLLEKIK